jgi:hypothetical protein
MKRRCQQDLIGSIVDDDLPAMIVASLEDEGSFE